MRQRKALQTATVVALLIPMSLAAPSARADLDGHGPDAWVVTGVSANDVLNARMGPGTAYPVITTFPYNERGLQQVTCVPFIPAAQYHAMTQAQISALPPSWCLMRDASMNRAGWVAQRYITPEGEEAFSTAARPSVRQAIEPYATDRGADPVAMAPDLIREIYERQFFADSGGAPSPFEPPVSSEYFSDEIIAWLAAGNLGGHPLYGAQDFDGSIEEPMADPNQPMLRGMVTVLVNFTNFGQPQRATFYLRADPTKAGAPLRIFRVEHNGWSYP